MDQACEVREREESRCVVIVDGMQAMGEFWFQFSEMEKPGKVWAGRSGALFWTC